MIEIPYDKMKFHFTTGHYDIHWSGTCIYNGKIAEYFTRDDSDYQLMNDTCPCCSIDGDNYNDCHCESYPDIICVITEIPLYKRIYWVWSKFYWDKFGKTYLYLKFNIRIFLKRFKNEK